MYKTKNESYIKKKFSNKIISFINLKIKKLNKKKTNKNIALYKIM